MKKLLVAASLVALATSACIGSSPGYVVSHQLAGGTGTVAASDLGLTLTASYFSTGEPSPPLSGTVSFSVLFGTGNGGVTPSSTSAAVKCSDVPWSALKGGQPISLASFTCTTDITNYDDAGYTPADFSAALATGTVTKVVSSFDTQDNGTLTLQLDVSADVTATQASHAASRALHVELVGLRGTVVFGDVSSGGFCVTCNM